MLGICGTAVAADKSSLLILMEAGSQHEALGACVCVFVCRYVCVYVCVCRPHVYVRVYAYMRVCHKYVYV